MGVSNDFHALSSLKDPVELWEAFEPKTLSASQECILGSIEDQKSDFTLSETEKCTWKIYALPYLLGIIQTNTFHT